MTAKATSSPLTDTSSSATEPRALEIAPESVPPSLFSVSVLDIFTPSRVVYVMFQAPTTS